MIKKIFFERILILVKHGEISYYNLKSLIQTFEAFLIFKLHLQKLLTMEKRVPTGYLGFCF